VTAIQAAVAVIKQLARIASQTAVVVIVSIRPFGWYLNKGQSNLAKGDIAGPPFWGKGRSYGIGDTTIRKSDDGFL